MKKNIYIIIVTYNAEKWIEKSFSYTVDYPKHWKIYIVDNASTDNSVKKITEKYPHFSVIRNTTNIGFGQANNIVLKIAYKNDADYVLLLNQDAWISYRNIEKLITTQENNKEFYIVSPIHLDGSGKKLDKSFSTYCDICNCPDFYPDHITKQLKDIYQTTQGNAAIWLLSKECLRNIGGFSPLFFHYGEDDDYRNRVLYHGYKIGIVPNCYGYHDRAYRDFTKELNINRMFIYRISLISNINKKFYKIFMINILNIFFLSLKHIIKRKYKEAFYDIKILFKLFFYIKRIYIHREISKKIGANFISLQ